MTIRDILNKATWDLKEDVKDYTIYFTHRGALNDTKSVNLSEVVGIYASHFEYIDSENVEGITYIPYHRILRIEKKEEVVYKKVKKKGEGGS